MAVGTTRKQARLKKAWKNLDPPLNWHALLSEDDRSDWATIHRFHALQIWNRAVGFRAKFDLLRRTALWPIQSIGHALTCTRAAGELVAHETGLSRRQQFFEQLRLAIFECISPSAYYLFRLYRLENQHRAHRFLHRYESKRPAQLFKAISPDARRASRLLCDKQAFHDVCIEHGIPTARIHFAIEASETRGLERAPQLPCADLFVKRRVGKGGAGAQAWSYTPVGDFVDATGLRLERDALLQRLEADAEEHDLLVQERIANHPEIEAFAGKALATARIMTVVNESERPEPVIAVFRMATGDSVVDNFHRGGIVASVDLKTGALGPAVSLSPTAPETKIHPETGLPFAGERVPGWREALKLAVRAHEIIGGRTVLGWDIGFGANGPILIEGNSSPGVHMLQCATGEPLGESRFAQLVVYHLRRRPA